MRIYVCFLIVYGSLSGCALAPLASTAFSTATSATFIESTAINGASYVTTGKGVSEHLLSGAADQDCKLYNIIDGKRVCQEYQLDKIPQRDLTTRYTTIKPVTVEDVIQIHTNQR
ncbi:hypothetical protein PSHI8_13080 [Polynucleobacter sp. SHI8]|uniref:hypothetical protein n=1 Tax=unclassified Polynucleobacter TaxID=2640945 RepID=UPI002492C080|nr:MULTISPECIES: hypothetical protein [unclassified Polynucleobacter]BDW11226.1 hypothetical protein PSHI2_13080 [Polynucleobacter sp. SHI2]BDW13672.1 hypothetical protein PSHI8_13080 [Polynucleobacter sp. SHI8]